MIIPLDHDIRYRYQCHQCRRGFTVRSEAARQGDVRCPACLGDDVAPWLRRRDHLMRFLMLYEAA